jgi:site-specific DNA recombinase
MANFLPSFSRCAIYTRQSRDSDSDFTSCEAQFEACLQFIRSQVGQGWIYNNLRYDDEGTSGETIERAGLKRVWQDIESGRIDRLVIYRLDRLSRKVAHCAAFLQKLRQIGIALTIVTSPELGTTACDIMVLHLLATFAEFEQEIIGERMAEARAALKSRGRRVAGAVPFGYVADPITKQLIPERAEARRVLAIFERAAKGESPRSIAEHANRRGWRTKQRVSQKSEATIGGSRWTPRQILETLSNSIYLGMIRDGNSMRPGIHSALVSRELFDRAAAHIAERRSGSKKRAVSKTDFWPLRGLITCGQCGRKLIPSLSGHGNISYSYYRCRSHAGGRPPCVGVCVPAAEIERVVCEMLGEPVHTESNSENSDQQKLRAMWVGLDSFSQRQLLPKLVQEITFDMRKGILRVEILPGAIEVVKVGSCVS